MRQRSMSSLFTATAITLAGLQAFSDVHAFDTSTSMRVYPQDGSVDFCLSTDCSASAPSLSIMPNAILQDTTIDYTTRTVTASTVLADFTTVEPVNSRWLTPLSYDSNALTYSSVLYARSCFTGCPPTPSSDYNFESTSNTDDALGMKVAFVQHGQSETLQSAYESYELPSGALTVNVSFALKPPSVGNTSLNYFAFSFLMLAIDSDGVPTTNVTIEGYPDSKMYLTRVYLGSDMYLDLPMYGVVDGADVMGTIGATGHTTGDLQDLVEITLAFPYVTSKVNYVFGVSSNTLRAASPSTTPSPSTFAPSTMPPSSFSPSTMPPSTTTPSTTPPTTTPPPAAPNATVPRMVLSSRGQFSLCGESDCSNGVVAMGFSGLASNTTNVRRFAHSPAFIFDSPRLTTEVNGVERYTSQFSAYVPQSRVRPLRPFSGGLSSDAVFSAMVDQYSDAILLPYADVGIIVPKGAIKYSINISQWQFASAYEVLRLNMSIQIQDARNSTQMITMDGATVSIKDDTKVLTMTDRKRLELPLRAIVDGVSTPIQVDVVQTLLDASQSVYGFTIAFTFPSFNTSLYYDPVLRAEPNSTRLPLDQVKKSGSWVVATILLVLLGLIVLVSVIRCTKKVKVKLDFSKIIP